MFDTVFSDFLSTDLMRMSSPSQINKNVGYWVMQLHELYQANLCCAYWYRVHVLRLWESTRCLKYFVSNKDRVKCCRKHKTVCGFFSVQRKDITLL